MTLMANNPAEVPAPVETVSVTIDGVTVDSPSDMSTRQNKFEFA